MKDAARPGRATGLKKLKQSPPKTPPKDALFFSFGKKSANPDASPGNKGMKKNQSLHVPHRSRATSPTKAAEKAQGKPKTMINPKPKITIKAARGSPFGSIGGSSSSSESSFSDKGVVPLPSPRRGANKKTSDVTSPKAASPSRTPTHRSRRVQFKIEAPPTGTKTKRECDASIVSVTSSNLGVVPITTTSHPVKEEGTKKKAKKAKKAKADAQEKTRTVREAPANTKRLNTKLEAVLEEKAIDDATNDTEAALASRGNEPLTMELVEERLAKQQKEHEKAMAALEKKLRKKEHDDKKKAKKAKKAKADAQEKTRTVREAPANTKRLNTKLEAVLEEKAIDDATNDTEAALASRGNEPLTMELVEERLAKQQKEHEKAMAALEKKLRKKEHDDNNDSKPDVMDKVSETGATQMEEPEEANPTKTFTSSTSNEDCRDDIGTKIDDGGIEGSKETGDIQQDADHGEQQHHHHRRVHANFRGATPSQHTDLAKIDTSPGIHLLDNMKRIETPSNASTLNNIVTALQTERGNAIQAWGQLREALAQLDVVKSDFRDAKGAYTSENFRPHNWLTRMTDRIEQLEHEMAMYGKSLLNSLGPKEFLSCLSSSE